MTDAILSTPPKERLREQFFRHAVGQWLFTKSEKISSYGFLAGNTILMVKDGVAITPSNLAGFLFVGCAIALRLSKKFPDLSFRLAGLCSLAGAASLTLGAYNANATAARNMLECGTTLAGFGVPSSMLLFQKELSALSEKWQHSQNLIKQKASNFFRYPVSGSAVLDSVGISSLYSRAVAQGDVGIGIATGAWILAEIGLIASDPRLQKQFNDLHKKSDARPMPAPAII